MDIRTKLVLALVAVALGSMIALGGFMYGFTTAEFKDSRLQQLNGLAESVEDGMIQIASGWRDRVHLIANQTELREILAENNLAGRPAARAMVRRILLDAADAEPAVEALAVYDAEGHFVGSVGWGTDPDLPEELSVLPTPEDDVVYQGVYSRGEGQFRVAYQAALTSDGTIHGSLVGVLLVRLNARPLARLTRIRSSLGETGETLLAIQTGEGIQVIRQYSEEQPVMWDHIDPSGPSDPVFLAMVGAVGPHSDGIIDDRGNPVWVAVRYFAENGWGLIVKINEEEGLEPAQAYGEQLTNVAISLAALAILAGTLLGLHFAKPVHELAATAERIKDGDLSVRAPVRAHDEVGLLARNFNQMADELEHQLTLLKEFQYYFDLSLDMLCIAGNDGYFKRVNPAFEKTLGWSTEELLSRSFLDFVHPDDLARTVSEIERLSQGLPTISFENRYMCSDGSEKILSWTAHPETGTKLIYAIARDVTDLTRERKATQARIEMLEDRLGTLESERGDS